MDPTDLQELPLTEEEKNHLIDAWLSYMHALAPDSEPDLSGLQHTPMFKATVNRILAAHDFEPFTATFIMGADNQLVLMARRLPSTLDSPLPPAAPDGEI
jgi:hypothetical protein